MRLATHRAREAPREAALACPRGRARSRSCSWRSCSSPGTSGRRRAAAHPFLNAPNALLILKYSSIYGIAAIGAAIVIISGGIDLAPGAVIALAGVVTGALFVERGWPLAGERRGGARSSASLPGC